MSLEISCDKVGELGDGWTIFDKIVLCNNILISTYFAVCLNLNLVIAIQMNGVTVALFTVQKISRIFYFFLNKECFNRHHIRCGCNTERIMRIMLLQIYLLSQDHKIWTFIDMTKYKARLYVLLKNQSHCYSKKLNWFTIVQYKLIMNKILHYSVRYTRQKSSFHSKFLQPYTTYLLENLSS